MGLKKAITSSLEDVIEKAGGCAVVDGGFATQLERHGAAINDPLWSAVCLIKQPDLIKRVCVCVSLSLYPFSSLFDWISVSNCSDECWVWVEIFKFLRFTWTTWKPALIFSSLLLTRFISFPNTRYYYKQLVLLLSFWGSANSNN